MIPLVWWVWPLGFISSILSGIALAAIIYYVYSYFSEKVLRKELPTVKSPKGKEITKDGGKVTILDEKEVKEDDRTKQDKYRQFEKLRRLAATDSSPERDKKQRGQGTVPDKTPIGTPDTGSGIDFD